MTLNVQFSWMDYTTDGVQTSFPYPFYVKEKPDLVAYWEPAGTPPWMPGQPLLQPLAEGFYTLTGLGQSGGGTLVTSSALPAGRLILKRGTPQNQLTDYLEGDAFPAASHETALDRLTMLVQDHQEVLSRASLLAVETDTAHRNLVLPDPVANAVLGWDSAAAQWTLSPSGVTAIPVDPLSSIGWGRNTVAVRPAAGAATAAALIFPAGVLAVAVTGWIATSFGPTQGLSALGIGTPEQPDRWGVLTTLTADTATTAGVFQSYSAQPQQGGGMITLTAYGGLFDGTGEIYLTGHFLTFLPSQQEGYHYQPPSPDGGQILPPLPVASDTVAGIVELATAAETTTGTDPTRAVTPAGLAAKVPSGTALSVARYAAGGQALEGAPGVLTTANSAQLVLGSNTQGLGSNRPLVIEYAGSPSIYVMGANGATVGSAGLVLAGARGSFATPAAVQSGDLVGFQAYAGYNGSAWSTNAAVCQVFAEEPWTSSAQATSMRFGTTKPGTVSRYERLRIDEQGNLRTAGTSTSGVTTVGTGAVGVLALRTGTAPTTSPADAVQLWSADRGGAAGTASLQVRTENGTSHVLGDLSGIGTLCDATLGVGSYQALNVKGSLLAVGQSSVQERAQALIAPSWVVSTDASRTARLTLSVYDATAAREGLRLEADGTAPRIGFLGAAAVVRQTLSAAATDPATTQTLANSLRTALINLGLGG